MGFTDFGLQQFGSFVVGSTVPNPNTIAFGTGSEAFNGSTFYLNDEFTRKTISWSWNGDKPRGEVVLGSEEAVGSVFAETGIGSGLTLGSNLWSRDLMAVGSKSPGIAVQVFFDFRARRF